MKQVIVVREDINMSKGKTAAQVAHASLLAAEQSRIRFPFEYEEWINGSYMKVVVKCKDVAELGKLFGKSKQIDIPNTLIRDEGRTEINKGTITCLAVGPAPDSLVDKVTKRLRLL